MLKNIFVSALVAVLVLVVGFQVFAPVGFGGLVNPKQEHFTSGLYAGLTDQFSIDSSGNLTSSGTSTLTGEVKAKVIVDGTVLSVASGSTTYTAANLCNSTLVRHNISGAPASLQFFKIPTAAALIADCLPDPGDGYRFKIENISNEEVLAFTKGTGIDVGVASGSNAGPVITAGQRAIVELTNLDDASVSFDIYEIKDGD